MVVGAHGCRYRRMYTGKEVVREIVSFMDM